jgi:hypothetical protein
MSSNSAPINYGASPFVATTTAAIERANRLMGVRAHPGFLDIIRIEQELIQEAVDACIDYAGWDQQMIMLLKVQMQIAKQHHKTLLYRINQAIEQGVAEAKEQVDNLPQKTAAEAVDQGDLVRQQVLERFEEFDSRPGGSY